MDPLGEDRDGSPAPAVDHPVSQHNNLEAEGITVSPGKTSSYPFKKWVDSFRSKKHTTLAPPERYVEGWFDEPRSGIDSGLIPFPNLQEQQWEQMSGSSVLETVKTASLSITSQSVATRSRATTQSSTHQSGCRSSARSNSETRMSMDSMRLASIASIDDATQTRAVKRRQVLNEIFTSEADYVTGLKALTDILSMILRTRPAIYRNVQQIRGMHEDFLARLRVVTPKSAEIPEAEVSSLLFRGLQERWSSVDLSRFKKSTNRSLRTRNLKASVDSRIKAVAAEPLEALEVARELDELSRGFIAYEDFCSKYELLAQDISILRRSVFTWTVFDQGIEALSKSIASRDSRKQDENKSMTLNDLLIKPIQRVCKYPLLLHDLLKYTPASDCPSAHGEINQILENMRLLISRINCATGNPLNRDRIQKTITLQDKLEFSEQNVLHDIYRQLGPMILCGVLHVAYRSTEQVTGEYMVCTLFHGYMVLARPCDDYRKLQVVACLYVLDMSIDTLANGKGLCCSDCPFSWKITFQVNSNSFELILSASSATEERAWKTELLKASAALPNVLPSESLEPRKYFMSSLDLAPLDRVKHQSVPLVRRSSANSLTAPNLKLNLEHVIIKRTYYPLHVEESHKSHDGEIERSRTLPITRSTTILAPRRQDRIRLERCIGDVYTRDVLPYPGMALTKGDYLFRASPGSLMRRISFHTPFSRRSSSMTTTNSRAVDPVLDMKEQDYWEDKEKEAILPLVEALPPKEDVVDEKGTPESSPDAPKGPKRTSTLRFKSVRRRMAGADDLSRTSSDRSTVEGKPSLKKRWNTSIAFFSVLSPRRSRGSRSSGVESAASSQQSKA